MKEATKLINIYCSPFLTLPSDWEVMSIPKYIDLPFLIEWLKSPQDSHFVIIPSHINDKSMRAFQSFLKTIPVTATLLVIPEPLSRLVDLIEVTSLELEHSIWKFPSSVLTPEEIIHQFKMKRGI